MIDESGQLVALIVFLGVPAAAMAGALFLGLRERRRRTSAGKQRSTAAPIGAEMRHAREAAMEAALGDGLNRIRVS